MTINLFRLYTGELMQLYFSSHQDNDSLLQLIQDELIQYNLQYRVTLQTLSNATTENQRDLSQLLDPSIATVLLGAGGAGTVVIRQLAKVIESLINSQKVEVKIKHKDTQIELSGPAGKIAKILEDTLK